MGGVRARTVCATVLVAAGLVLTLRGQTAGDWRLQILEHVGLPAIDEGMIADESHTPSSPETLRRAALLEALLQDRVGASGRVLLDWCCRERDARTVAGRLGAPNSDVAHSV